MTWFNVIVAVAVGLGVVMLTPRVAATGPTRTAAQADESTPVLLRPAAAETAPFQGDDGRFRVVYELWLTNAKAVPATVVRIEVLDADNPSRVVQTLAGADLAAALATLDTRPANGTGLGPNESRLVYIELAFDDAGQVPAVIAHRFTGTGAANPGARQATPLSYVAARWPLDRVRPPVLGPPLRGDGWVAFNG